MTQKYLTDRQVAERFGISRVSVWLWSRETDFPAPIQMPGRCTRWSIADVEQWEREQNENKMARAS